MNALQMKKTVIAMTAFYSRQLPDEAVNWYVDDLIRAGLTSGDLNEAFGAYRATDKTGRMPTVAQLIDIHNPQATSKDLARDTALRIREAVARNGWSDPEGARAFIGAHGWRAVARFGGWRHICENLGVSIQESTFIAQMRDAIESDVNLGRAGYDPERPALEQASERGQLSSAKDILKTLMIGGKNEQPD